ncbi:type IV secretory system conjugative DNA transfer family protein [Amycolatopsis sp. NBC_01286]|uniref:type IV secretory system conjugative DNA transfer family protein n=1 Tax=Amycolatopsis sp. NBC_01286 TaxID=2903560 RepID=UPI002E0E0669|nr:type IV secretory system conjugative DNA transfer family protein [Amycolatopsis sp. NBC_01286]
MIDLYWYEAFPPRDATLADVTAMVRVLAGRPHYGLLGLQPVVVFELWVHSDRVRWLLGIEARIARTLPGELRGQLPGLVLAATDNPQRPATVTAREIRVTSVVHPIRLDTARQVTTGLTRLQDALRSGEAVAVQWVIGPSQTSTTPPDQRSPLELLGFGAPHQPGGEEQRGWKARLSEPRFGVRGRVGSVAPTLRRAAELLRPAVSALGLASAAHARVYGSRQSTRTAEQLAVVMGRARSWSGMLNASELAVLLGWSLDGLEVAGGASDFAPPPAPLLRAVTAGAPGAAARPLGVSTHPAAGRAAVWLPRSSYGTHCHVIAPSGAGKSTLLAQWVTAEAAADGSLIVIEPKGDLVLDVLARLPQPSRHQVVVIDPGVPGPVIGFNPLSGPPADAERRADTVLGLLRELFGSAIGPRSADVLLHGLILASRLPDGGLTDIIPILTNPRLRRSVAARVGDPLTIDPWLAWFDNLSEPERTQVVQPVANKLRPWTARPAVRHLIGQAHPKFDVASVFARPTILLINLNAGVLGSETARLVGSLILSQLWQAIQRQTAKPAPQRRPVSVFVDEWQSFTAGLDFADVLARARGANVSFTVAHQHLDQLGSELRAAVLANVGARVAFRPAEGDGRTLANVFGAPVTAADLERLPAYHAAARVLVNGAPSQPFEVATPALSDALADPVQVRQASTDRYGMGPAEVDAELLKRWHGSTPPSAPLGSRRAPR